MSKVRDIVRDADEEQGPSLFARMSDYSLMGFHYALGVVNWGYSHARVIGWFVVTTGIITALPLIFEVRTT
jgi:hypothetical protein